MTFLPVVLIAAMGRNRVIGIRNALPWRLRSDLRHFRAATLGQSLLMGRKTYQSIGRSLPGRFPVVLSADPLFRPEGVAVARTLDGALDEADRIGRDAGATAIMVAGGGAVFEATVARARRLCLTEVDLAPDGDVLFPPVDPALWVETGRSAHPAAEGDDAPFSVVTYDRRRP